MFRRLLLTAALLIVMCATASAQVVTRCYVTGRDGVGSFQNPWRVKYFQALNTKYGTTFHTYDAGRIDAVMVCASITAAAHTEVSANADVLSFPANLDSTITNPELAVLQNRLEAIKIPGDFFTAGMTYRQVGTFLMQVFTIDQKFDGLFGKTFFEGTITLDTRANQLTAGQRGPLVQTLQALGIDASSFSGATTIRQLLKTMTKRPVPSLHGVAF